MKNLVILAIVFLTFFFMYRTCTKGYDTYGYFVQVKNESVFATALSDADPRIIEHGRRLKTDIISKDIEVDNALSRLLKLLLRNAIGETIHGADPSVA